MNQPLSLSPPSLLPPFLRLAGVLLLAVSAAKFITVYSGSKGLFANEPLSGISYAKLTTLIAVLEGIAGTAAVLFPRSRYSAYGIAWLGILFSGYKAVRIAMGLRSPCRCLGSLFAWWPWGAAHERALSWAIIGVLLVSSGLSILFSSVPAGRIGKTGLSGGHV